MAYLPFLGCTALRHRAAFTNGGNFVLAKVYLLRLPHISLTHPVEVSYEHFGNRVVFNLEKQTSLIRNHFKVETINTLDRFQHWKLEAWEIFTCKISFPGYDYYYSLKGRSEHEKLTQD